MLLNNFFFFAYLARHYACQLCLYICHKVTGFTKIPKWTRFSKCLPIRGCRHRRHCRHCCHYFFSHAHNVTRLWRLTRSTKLLNVQSVCDSNKWVNLILLCVHCCFVVFFSVFVHRLYFSSSVYFGFCCCPSFFFSFMPFGLPKWPVSLTDTLHSLSIHLASFFFSYLCIWIYSFSFFCCCCFQIGSFILSYE